MENWKPIDNTGGMIEVSSYGRVRSNLRDGRILKASTDRKGYLRVRYTYLGEKRSIKVHREVAKAFVNNPEKKPQVNHIDGNKKNNRADNLEWVSNVENSKHAIDSGLWENVFAASAKTNESRKTPIIATDATTGEEMHFDSVSEAERYFKSRHISDVLNGKRGKAAGCYFRREVTA